MANKTYNKLNFHSYTFCIWKEVLFSEISDLKINYKSQSGSQYIFTAEGLYRISNHWGRVANCHWRLIPLADFKNQNTIVGFANWTDFYSNDDTSKLFFIKVNDQTNEVSFYHKLSLQNQEKVILRNAKETAKTIQIIKKILTETDWSKYLKYEDLDILRKEIVNELVNSEKSFLEIKKQYL
ncbi:hypothetical protein QWY90_07340 [Flavobacterium paronense]|uniref:Uncharacterized protein n=1 Tax=Flavobacterium paronense TaxID=1392775 RepID=A0ABV5GGR1_9FLAO|nr:hypothetical protein [Flavobacterium paronense]MDN3677124.1 hypothetical protein [Flavobacterium paronense]